MAPLVTVVIPTYNHAHFLYAALQSVCGQTFHDWEAVVVNNYSADDTIAVVEAFGDTRIRLENFHNNGIIAAGRNRGIAMARGEYLAFLDSDDIWFPEKLAICIPQLEAGYDLVCHGLRWFGNGGEKDKFFGPARRATFNEMLYKGNCIGTSATLVRKNLVQSVGGFSEDEEIVTAEDYHLWMKLAHAGARMGFIKQVLGRYRLHSGNAGTVMRQTEAVRRVFNEFYDAQPHGLIDRIRRRFRYGTLYYAEGRGMQSNGQFPNAWSYLLRSLAHHPFYLKTYVALIINIFHFNNDK